MLLNISNKFSTATTPFGTSLLQRFIHIVPIPTAEAPLTSLFNESPICTTSSADNPVLFNAYSKSSFLGLYDLASSLVKTPSGFNP